MAKNITEIRSVARAHTKTAINILAGIARQETAPPSARVAAAVALLDRGWGRPSQQIDMDAKVEGVTVEIVRFSDLPAK